MPAAFDATYTPIAAAGTSTQIRHLARLLAAQLVVWANDGSGVTSGEGANGEKYALVRQLVEKNINELGDGGSNADSAAVNKKSRVSLNKFSGLF